MTFNRVFIALPLLAAAAQAQALTANTISARWVQGDPFANPSVTPHNIAGAEALLGLQAGDPGFVATATTSVERLDFFDGSPGGVGVVAAGTLYDPFTAIDPTKGTPLNDPIFAVSVTGSFTVQGNSDFTFQVHSDDGFDFRLDGVSLFQLDSDRGPGSSFSDRVALTAGEHSFELIGWEQGGQFALELSLAAFGSTTYAVLSTIPAPVPVPAALPLLATALAGLGFGARRRPR